MPLFPHYSTQDVCLHLNAGVGNMLLIVGIHKLNGELVDSRTKQSAVDAVHSVEFSMHLHSI